MSTNAAEVDLAGRIELARLPDDGARARALAAKPAVEHGAAGQHDGRNVDRGRRHQLRRRGLVAAGGEHHAVDGVAVEDFDQAQIGEVAVERGGGALAGLLNRVDGKLEGDAARLADALAHARRQHEVMPVTGREVGARLRDADDGLACGQLLARQAVVHVPLEIDGGHVGVVGIGEPLARAQLLDLGSSRLLVGHRRFLWVRRVLETGGGRRSLEHFRRRYERGRVVLRAPIGATSIHH